MVRLSSLSRNKVVVEDEFPRPHSGHQIVDCRKSIIEFLAMIEPPATYETCEKIDVIMKSLTTRGVDQRNSDGQVS